MDSFDDSLSIELYEDRPKPLPGKDCQLLFDQFCRQDDNADDNLPVRRPVRTYQGKRQPLLNIRNRDKYTHFADFAVSSEDDIEEDISEAGDDFEL